MQHSSEKLHFFPHLPQLSLSTETLTHCLLQQSGPLLPATVQTLGYLSQVTFWAMRRPCLCVKGGFLSVFDAESVTAITITTRRSNNCLNSIMVDKWYMWDGERESERDVANYVFRVVWRREEGELFIGNLYGNLGSKPIPNSRWKTKWKWEENHDDDICW